MWTKEQEMAINKKNSNILVSASAGSGKTAILVERVISTCLNQKVDIDKILVVTFTNASATELKERLISAIYKELKKNENTKFLKRQLNIINRANITTIHSFCLNLIRNNFYVLGIDPNFRIADEVESNLLKNKAIAAVIEKHYEEYNKIINDTIKKKEDSILFYDLLELFSQNEEYLIEEILKIYNYSLSFPYPFKYLNDSIEMYNIDNLDVDLSNLDFGKFEIEDTIGNINVLKKRCEGILQNLKGMEDFSKYYEVTEDDIKLLDKIIYSSNSWDSLFYELSNCKFKNNPRYSGQNVELKEKILNFRSKVLKDSIKKIKLNIYANSKDILLQNKKAYKYLKYIYTILKDLDKEYKNIKASKNVLDFSDIEHLALSLLVNHNNEEYSITEIASHLKEEFFEIYTDEYQDTSYVQEAILNAIAKGNNRFMVGDIKQSIYKFRQAMPDIFNEKYKSYQKLINVEQEIDNCKILLDKNFRSRKIVLDSINYIFEKIMSMRNGDAEYDCNETLKAGNESFKDYDNQNYKTEINVVDLEKKQDKNDEILSYIEENKAYQIEALNIADKVESLVENYKIYDLKSKEFKKAAYKDIVILLRSTKDKALILEKVFKEKNIPVFSDSSSSLLDNDEVKLVMSFLKVMDNPFQDIHLASIMYSIIGNFTLDEMVKIRQDSKKVNFYYNILNTREQLENGKNLDESSQILLNKINKFLEILEKFNEYKHIFTISQLLARVYKETNIYYQFALEEDGNFRKANLNRLIDVATSFEKNEESSLRAYIEYIDNMKNKSDFIASAKTIGENEDVVRIMTIHKSKGLEFPIVILSDSNKKYNLKDKSSIVTMHHKFGLGINVVDENLRITYPSIIKKSISKLIDNETRSEELRMLYVALTRAKEKLIIYSTVDDYQNYKEKELILYEENKIDPYLISKNNSYFQNIHMALENCNLNLFDVNIIKPNAVINNFKEDKKSSRQLFEEKFDYDKSDVDDINNIINFEYPYKDYINAKTRVGVSDLKNKGSKYNKDVNDKYLLDNLIIENKKIDSLQKGTITHFILEHIDFNITNEDMLENYLKSLVKNNIISLEQIKVVDKLSILKFLNSNIAKEIRKSHFVKQEAEFIFKDNDIALSQIQGIIDLYYENSNNNLVLVDFKTDKVINTDILKTNYSLQLDIYAKALEKITGKKVEKKIIYSLYLNKEIII